MQPQRVLDENLFSLERFAAERAREGLDARAVAVLLRRVPPERRPVGEVLAAVQAVELLAARVQVPARTEGSAGSGRSVAILKSSEIY